MNAHLRAQTQSVLRDSEWDLLVVGGGITGAGVALDAVTRGLRVCLVEGADYASGTSSRSTRLIHGGLRYLKQWDFKLVKETGREREVIRQVAPHLVIAGPMLLPLVQGGSFGKCTLSLALRAYDWLAAVPPDERRRMLNSQEASQAEPLLRKSSLRGAGRYHEYRTDDARLTLALLKTAAGHGACCLNYVRVTALSRSAGGLHHAQCKEMLSGREFAIRARAVVNATGPWVDQFRSESERKRHSIIHSKGAHIVLPREALPLQGPVYFDSPEGRLIFAIPEGEITYVGTTDEEVKLADGPLLCTAADVRYLLQAVNAAFETELKSTQVIAGWAGIRPLLRQGKKNTKEISRRDEVIESPSGLLTIAGGKLTGYRKMAARTVDRVMEQLRLKGASVTETVKVSDAGFEGSPEAFAQQLAAGFAEVPFREVQWLVHFFGSAAGTILKRMRAEGVRLSVAMLRYCVEAEGCVSLADFLVRRTRWVFRGRAFVNEKCRELAGEDTRPEESLAGEDTRPEESLAGEDTRPEESLAGEDTRPEESLAGEDTRQKWEEEIEEYYSATLLNDGSVR